MLEIALSEADGQLSELVTRAEAGEEVVLTRNGRAAVRLTPVAATPDRPDRAELRRALDEIRVMARAQRDREDAEFNRVFDEVQAAARARPSPGPCAARSQDFLYDDEGLPA